MLQCCVFQWMKVENLENTWSNNENRYNLLARRAKHVETNSHPFPVFEPLR